MSRTKQSINQPQLKFSHFTALLHPLSIASPPCFMAGVVMTTAVFAICVCMSVYSIFERQRERAGDGASVC